MIYTLHQVFKTRIAGYKFIHIYITSLLMFRFVYPEYFSLKFIIIMGTIGITLYLGIFNFPYLFIKNIVTIYIYDKAFPDSKFIYLDASSKTIGFSKKRIRQFITDTASGIRFGNEIIIDDRIVNYPYKEYLHKYLEKKFNVTYVEEFENFIYDNVCNEETESSLAKKLILRSFNNDK